VGWTLIVILLATGTLNLFFVGLLDTAVLGSDAFWTSPYGRALLWKLTAVAAMLGLSASHDFVLGPAASRREAGSPEAERARRWASWLARLTALAGLAVVLAAVRLARGG
jgi:copper resistance protein D